MISRIAGLTRVDPGQRHPMPRILPVLSATVASVAGSLLADAVLVAVGEAVFPATKGYPHFQLGDYGRLTVIGVLIACAGWPAVARLSWDPRWVYLRLAVLVTLVLWLPDLYILHQGQSVQAVAVLMVMHLAIALVTYNLVVRLAAVGQRDPASPRSRRGR